MRKVKIGGFGIAAGLLLVLILISYVLLQRTEREVSEYRVKLGEMERVYKEYSALLPWYDFLKEHLAPQERGLAVEAERILEEEGLKEHLQKVTPLKRREGREFSLEGVSLSLENMPVEGMVRLLTRLSTLRDGVFLGSVTIRRDFQKNDLLDLGLEVYQVKGTG